MKISKTSCGKEAKALSEGSLTDDQIDEIGKKVLDIKNKGGSLSKEEINAHVLGEIQKRQAEIKMEKGRALMNFYAEQDIDAGMKSAKENGYSNGAEAMEANLMGIVVDKTGSRKSVSVDVSTSQKAALMGLVDPLQKLGLDKFLLNESNHREITRALHIIELNYFNSPEVAAQKIQALGYGQIGKDAMNVAEIAFKNRMKNVDINNAHMAFIQPLEGYIHKITHNVTRILNPDGGIGFWDNFRSETSMSKKREASYKRWSDFVRDRLDWDKIIERLDVLDKKLFDKEQFLRSNFEVIVTKHQKMDAEIKEGFDIEGFNLQKQANQMRMLMWKNADSLYEYNMQYGNGNLTATLRDELMTLGRFPAMMRRLGSNPAALIEKQATKLKNENRLSEAAQLNSNRFKSYVKYLTGQYGSDTQAYAIAGKTLRDWMTATKLGSTGLTSLFMDGAGTSGLLRMNGMELAEAYTQPAKMLFENATGKQLEYRAAGLTAGMEGFLSKVHETVTGGWDVAGKASATAGNVIRWSGTTFVTDAYKVGTQQIYSHMFASLADRKLTEIGDANVLKLFRQYEITEREWNVLRKHIGDINGTKMMFADNILEQPIEQYMAETGMTKTKAILDRENIVAKYRSLLEDQAEFAVVTPDAKQQAWVSENFKRGTPMGETMLLAYQLKGFAVSLMLRPMKKAFTEGGVTEVAKFTAMLTAMGTVLYLTKQIGRGQYQTYEGFKENWGKILAAGFLQSGGVGIAGDVVNGAVTNPNFNATDVLLGPGLSTFNQAFKVTMQTIKSPFTNDKAFDDKHIKFIKSMIPMQNAPFLSEIMNRSIWYNLIEIAKPGTMNKYEKQAKEGGREYIFPLPD